MGGRGASSGSKVKSGGFNSLDVLKKGSGGTSMDITTKDGYKDTYSFAKDKDGTYLYSSGKRGGYEPTPKGMKPSEMAERMKKNGVKVNVVSKKEIAKREKKYKEERKKSKKQLDILWPRGAGTPRHGWKGH